MCVSGLPGFLFILELKHPPFSASGGSWFCKSLLLQLRLAHLTAPEGIWQSAEQRGQGQLKDEKKACLSCRQGQGEGSAR